MPTTSTSGPCPDAEVAAAGAVARDAGGDRPGARQPAEAGVYYDALRPACTRLEIWHTIYNQVLDDARHCGMGQGDGPAPFVDPLSRPNAKHISPNTRAHRVELSAQADGKVAARFPRIFIVAVR